MTLRKVIKTRGSFPNEEAAIKLPTSRFSGETASLSARGNYNANQRLHNSLDTTSLNFQFSLFRIHFIMQSECPFRVPLHQFQNLIHRQCHHTEHQVRHHFGRTSHPYVPPSKLVLQSPVDPLHPYVPP